MTAGASPDEECDGILYGTLEPVRQYAREKLEESGDAEEVRRRHAGYYLALAERAGIERSTSGDLARAAGGRARQPARRDRLVAGARRGGGGVGVALGTAGLIALGQREYERGLSNITYCLEGLATIAASEDRLERAARLWGAAEGRLEEIEVMAYPHASDRAPYHAQVDAARARLDREAWERAWAEGRAMTTEQAVAEALGGRLGTPRGEG